MRIEELVNYFEYDYPQPAGDLPFSVNTEVAAAPVEPETQDRPDRAAGQKRSARQPAALEPRIFDRRFGLDELARQTAASEGFDADPGQPTHEPETALRWWFMPGRAGLVLPSTPVGNKGEILNALNSLNSGGSTNGGAGIKLAYQVAAENFIKGGNNRVILATDGDFNVGLSSDDELVGLIEQKRKSGVFLSVLGFGTGNLNDSMMEKLADKGNGNYSYIDSEDEARKALGSEVAGTLFTIAKDVKIQVEFNPAKVAGYRLIGYENRLLANRDFEDDQKDAGEIGAGHSVTALYEVIPAGQKVDNDGIELKYSKYRERRTRISAAK